MKAAARTFLVLAVILAATASASAHSRGGSVESRIDFPPWLLWVSGSFVVALSFAVVGAFLTGRGKAQVPAARVSERTFVAGQVAGLVLLVLAVAGSLVSQRETASLLLFVVILHLVPAASYLLGNAWEPFHPFRPLLPLAASLRGSRAPLRWPSSLGVFPAVLLVLALPALEAAGLAEGTTAWLLAGYTTLTLVGMVTFGESWLRNAEVFSVAARAWATFAPLLTPRGLRRVPAGAGRGEDSFVVALLVGVNLDGLLATNAGRSALAAAAAAVGDGAALPLLVVATFGLFLGAWRASVLGVAWFAESLEPRRELSTRFAPSLVPIAAGYHLAHAGPQLVELVTPIPADLLPALGAAQVLVILAGHVLAVTVAHRAAFRGFDSRIQAVRSEAPLTLAMILYTMIGLSILSSASGVGV